MEITLLNNIKTASGTTMIAYGKRLGNRKDNNTIEKKSEPIMCFEIRNGKVVGQSRLF